MVSAWRWQRITLCEDVWLQNTSSSVCKAWCSSSSVGFLPALYSSTKGAQHRCVCVSRWTHEHKPEDILDTLSSSSGQLRQNLSWKHTNQTSRHFVQLLGLAAPQTLLLLCVSGVLVGQVKAAGAVVIRWPKGGRPLVVEFSANTARTWLSFLPTLGMENGAATATPANTQHAGQSLNFSSCMRSRTSVLILSEMTKTDYCFYEN